MGQQGAYLGAVRERSWSFIHGMFGKARLLASGADLDIVDKVTDCPAESRVSKKPHFEKPTKKCEVCLGTKKSLKEAQAMLKVTVDGMWGPGSNGALNAFQEKHGHELTDCLTPTSLE